MSFAECKFQLQRADFAVDVEFTIPAKGVLCIFGYSGSGKTTLLRCLAGLEKKVKGQIVVNGEAWLDGQKSLSIQSRNIGYIFQESRLFPHMTVAGNLAYGAKRNDTGNSEDAFSVDNQRLLELLNIKHLRDRHPFQLSGGEKQRVAIARALLKNPKMLLLDEPLASLDEKRKREILPYLERLHEELSIPMLYVSHSMDEVLRLCDHILIMDQGKISFQGGICDALVSPQSPLSVAENAAVVLEGAVSKQEKDYDISTVHTINGNQFQVPGLMPIGKHVRLTIFASDVSVTKIRAQESSILNIIEGSIYRITEKQGGRVLLHINCNQDILSALISVKSLQLLQLTLQSKVYIQVKAVVTHGI